jgi:nitrile hydratase accessory protein
MTTSSQPDAATAERLSTLPRLPRDGGGPVFPLAVKLSEQGHFTWNEWAVALAEELKAAESRGQPDDGTHYYEHWLAALERLVVEKRLTDRQAMRERKEAWTEAYLHTPHGEPVELNDSVRRHKHG